MTWSNICGNPEQQRRPSLGDSIQQLRRDFDRYGGLSFDAVDVADMLWLSQFIELGQDIPDQSDEASDTMRLLMPT